MFVQIDEKIETRALVHNDMKECVQTGTEMTVPFAAGSILHYPLRNMEGETGDGADGGLEGEPTGDEVLPSS